ncbi:hypothetical protein SAMN05660297_02649 [Natronincola peptidivorans]|uniref:ABC-2 family transporter protein n=1 Tax=Natronincola peptidivorans TaxID=426128 RepID=A0A1I0F4B6_9FIRM|nr:hypothetical protein [Natronincola peptidivorans]SET52074.1 hypothetical protein SAMN05660297_02649 [Natronincola peptidivorans]
MLKLVKMHFVIMIHSPKSKALLFPLSIFAFFTLISAVLFYIDMIRRDSSIASFNISMFFPLWSIYIFSLMAAANGYSATAENDSKKNSTNDGIMDNILPVGRRSYFFARVLFTLCNSVIIWCLILIPFFITGIILKSMGVLVDTDFFKLLFFTTSVVVVGGVGLSIIYVAWKRGKKVLEGGIILYTILPIASFFIARSDYLGISANGWIIYPAIMAMVVLMLFLWVLNRIQGMDMAD